MLNAITLIFSCQLAGELVATALGISIPGPVIGMVVLFAILMWRGGISHDLGQVADGLLRHMSLLFVPAGVGVMLHFGLLKHEWLPISVALVVSTVLAVIVTALVMTVLGRHGQSGGRGR